MVKSQKLEGMVALPTVLLVGGIIIEIGIAGLLISYFLIQSIFGARWSAEALATARSGIQDGIIKIVRNKNLDYTASGSPYSLPVGNWTAQVAVCKDAKTLSSPCDTSSIGKHEVISSGVVKNKQRKLQAILNVSGLTGEVKVESIKEISL